MWCQIHASQMRKIANRVKIVSDEIIARHYKLRAKTDSGYVSVVQIQCFHVCGVHRLYVCVCVCA